MLRVTSVEIGRAMMPVCTQRKTKVGAYKLLLYDNRVINSMKRLCNLFCYDSIEVNHGFQCLLAVINNEMLNSIRCQSADPKNSAHLRQQADASSVRIADHQYCRQIGKVKVCEFMTISIDSACEISLRNFLLYHTDCSHTVWQLLQAVATASAGQ